MTTGGLKEKDLLLVPYLLAAALRADGWYLRSDIIWHKTACLPEPVRDRPAASHEHVFLLAKSKRYFFDADAIAEPSAPASAARYAYGFDNAKPGRGRTAVEGRRTNDGVRGARDVWSISASGARGGGGHPATMPPELAERCILAGSRRGGAVLDPFGGAGTTAFAAARLGRLTTLVELSPKYAADTAKKLGPLLGRYLPVWMVPVADSPDRRASNNPTPSGRARSKAKLRERRHSATSGKPVAGSK